MKVPSKALADMSDAEPVTKVAENPTENGCLSLSLFALSFSLFLCANHRTWDKKGSLSIGADQIAHLFCVRLDYSPYDLFVGGSVSGFPVLPPFFFPVITYDLGPAKTYILRGTPGDICN